MGVFSDDGVVFDSILARAALHIWRQKFSTLCVASSDHLGTNLIPIRDSILVRPGSSWP